MHFASFALSCALFACSTDMFTGPDGAVKDGATSDASAGDAAATDASPGDALASDATNGDAASAVLVQCGSGTTCTNQICCGPIGWTTESCSDASKAGMLGCKSYLSCDDSSDCTGGYVCCATQSSGTGGNVLGVAACKPGCTGSGDVQLCASPSDCGGSNCNAYPGAPAWVKSCQ